MRAPQLEELVNAPRVLAERLMGPGESFARLVTAAIRPSTGSNDYPGTNVEALMHIDDALAIPAPIQIMVCHQQARSGGESTFVDTWAMARAIRRKDPKLFRALYRTVRLHRYTGNATIRPTIAWRYGNLVFTHGALQHEWDVIGQKLQVWVDKAPRIRFRAEAGDIFVANNLRLLHGRDAFSGARHFTRILAWPSTAHPVPQDLAAPAQRIARKLQLSLKDRPFEAREHLAPSEASAVGLRRFAIVASYLSGEDPVALGARHGIDPREIVAWAEKTMRALPAALGQIADRETTTKAFHQAWYSLPEQLLPDVAQPRRG